MVVVKKERRKLEELLDGKTRAKLTEFTFVVDIERRQREVEKK